MANSAVPQTFDGFFTKDIATNRFQSSLKASVESFLDVPFLNGALIEDVSVNVGVTTDVPHTLNRAYRGWLLVDNNASVIVHRDSSSTADPQKFLPLTASSAATITVWVF